MVNRPRRPRLVGSELQATSWIRATVLAVGLVVLMVSAIKGPASGSYDASLGITVRAANDSGGIEGAERSDIVKASVDARGSVTQAGPSRGIDRVLVIRRYTASRPLQPSSIEVIRAFKRVHRYYDDLSRERFGLRRAVVSDWVRIGPCGGCTGAADRKHSEAVRKVRAEGINPAAFDHVVLYVSCRGDVAGRADMSDDYGVASGRVSLYGNLGKRVIAHELLHNQGLVHANLWRCRKNGRPVTYGSACSLEEYGDSDDIMGGGYQLNPAMRAYLGLLDGRRAVTDDRQISLRLLGGEQSPQAVLVTRGNVVTGDRWWVDLLSDSNGLVVHRYDALVDAVPAHSAFALPEGSTLTLPHGIRISAVAVGPDRARVAIEFRSPPAQVPAQPGDVQAVAGPHSAAIWQRPADRGAPIHAYEVTAFPRASRKIVPSAGGVTTSTFFGNLDSETAYTFQVRALNQVGKSSAGSTEYPVTPTHRAPMYYE